MISFPLDINEPSVTKKALENLRNLALGAPTGGMYPVGSNGLWHGGLHLSIGEEPPVYAAAAGRIVAARLDPDPDRATAAYGHTNFILTEHTWPPTAGEEEGTPYYMLYMHLAPRPLEAVAQQAGVVPWLTGKPLLRVTAKKGLRVRSGPTTDADRIGGIPNGHLAKPHGDPTDQDGHRWQAVEALKQDLEGQIALGPLKNGQLQTKWTEEAPPPGGSDQVGKLESGDVANLDVPVEAGEMLWWGGKFGQDLGDWEEEFLEIASEAMGYPEPLDRAPTVHWEIFSAEKAFGLGEAASGNGKSENGPSENGQGENSQGGNSQEGNGRDGLSMPSWTPVEDSDLTFNPKESNALSLIKEKRQAATELPDDEDYHALSLGEKKSLHYLPEGEKLQTYAVKYPSEWGLGPDGIEQALTESPAHSPDEHTKDFEAFQFWNEAQALPDSPDVWHYHPVTALKALAATGYSHGPHSISQKGLELIADFEGFRSEPYEDSAGHCTIGYGHLLHHGNCTPEDEKEYSEGITEAEARELLREDVSEFESVVNRLVDVPLRQNQFDALVSFVFNVGESDFESSTLLELLNDRKYSKIPKKLKKWVYAGGEKVSGLEKRREREGRLFSVSTQQSF